MEAFAESQVESLLESWYFVEFNPDVVPGGECDGVPCGVSDGFPCGVPDGVPGGVFDGVPFGVCDGAVASFGNPFPHKHPSLPPNQLRSTSANFDQLTLLVSLNLCKVLTVKF